MPKGYKRTLTEFKEIAIQKGGVCLSVRYVNGTSELLWRCKNNHTWTATGNSISTGSWCKKCAHATSRMTIHDLQALAKKFNGTLLSEEYVNAQLKLQWKCESNHIFEKPYRDVYSGQWCPFCSTRPPKSIVDMQKMASQRGGKCISKSYKNAKGKLLWECANGHRFSASGDSVKSNHWCAICVNVKKRTIEEAREIAAKRGGWCTSTHYKNAGSLLSWKCKFRHSWKANLNSITNGRWCPTCSSGLGERLCRVVFEKYLRAKFPTTHPTWLKSSDNTQLELDGYNVRLKLAFEHHGRQHFERLIHFQRNSDSHSRQIKLDKEKQKLCKKYGIKLVIIPEVPGMLPLEELNKFIFRKLKSFGFMIKMIDQIDYSSAYQTSVSSLKMEQMRKWAQINNGELLSKHYVNARTKMRWKCAEGHIWETAPSSRKLNWCFQCARKNLSKRHRFTVKEINRVTSKYSIRCLSDSRSSADQKLKWTCAKGHKWIDTWSNVSIAGRSKYNVRFGNWCPRCRKNHRLAEGKP